MTRDMFRQIFKQLWFYRRSNAWLFVELVVIIAASWFIVNETWTTSYRIHNVPDGFDARNVYCVYLTNLSKSRNGFDPVEASLERQRVNLRRFGDALRAMPEVQTAAPVSTNHPVDGLHSMMGIQIDSVNHLYFSTFERESGAQDFGIFRYDLVYPENGAVDDSHGSVFITKDLADYLYPGQNPVGKTIAASDKVMFKHEDNIAARRIAGVIGYMRPDGFSDNVPYVIENFADMVGEYGGDQMYAFRLKPGVDGEKFLENASKEWRKSMQFGNYRVTEVYSFQDRMEAVVQIEKLDKLFIWKALWLFMLFNALLAVASTGWLRMEDRRGEIGVRRAMGGSPRRILLHYVEEVWVVFAAAAVIGILITVNIIVLGKIDIASSDSAMVSHGLAENPLNMTDFPLLFDPVAHFLAVEGIVLGLLLLAVTAAILIPAAGALRRPPVEALRDE